MLHVDLDNILTHDELASKAEEVLRKADEERQIVVITRNGRPAVAVLKLEQLEELSGREVSTNHPATELPPMEQPTPSNTEEHHEEPAQPAPEQHNDSSGLPDMPA
jgi:prevent-host-death family protein